MRQLLIITLCVCGLFFVSNPIHPEYKMPNIEEAKAQVMNAAEDMKQLLYVKEMLDKTQETSQEIQNFMNQGNASMARSAIQMLGSQIKNVSTQMKGLMGPAYHTRIDDSSQYIHQGLANMDQYITEDNMDKAQKELVKVMNSSGSLTGYFNDSYGHLVDNKEDVKGWMGWITDGLVEWWYGSEDK